MGSIMATAISKAGATHFEDNASCCFTDDYSLITAQAPLSSTRADPHMEIFAGGEKETRPEIAVQLHPPAERSILPIQTSA
jgi:hypothetical protein